MRIVRYLLIAEALINSISTLIFLIQPEMMLQGLIADTSQITPLALEMLRWYGTMLLMLTIILWRALFSKNSEFLRHVIEAYIIGDIVYIVVQIQLANLAGWVFGTYFGIGFIIILFFARAWYLWKTRHSALQA